MEKTKKSKWLCFFIVTMTVLLALVCLCRWFVLDWYTVSGGSMNPTYEDGQTVFGYKLGTPNRFDAVVVDASEIMQGTDMEFLFKRIVATEGDEIWSEDGVLCLSFDGQTHKYENEKYGDTVLGKMPVDIPRQIVPKGKVFVLGDNRETSIDSRTFGFVDVSQIEAIVL